LHPSIHAVRHTENTYTQEDKGADSDTYIQAYIHTIIYTHKHTETYGHSQAGINTNKQTHSETDILRHARIHTDRQTG